jgi:hypothetical protein
VFHPHVHMIVPGGAGGGERSEPVRLEAAHTHALFAPGPCGTAWLRTRLARVVAEKMSEDLGQQVIVDNRPGAAQSPDTCGQRRAHTETPLNWAGAIARSDRFAGSNCSADCSWTSLPTS